MRTAFVGMLITAALALTLPAAAGPGLTDEGVHQAVLSLCRQLDTAAKIRAAGYAPARPGMAHLNGGNSGMDLAHPKSVVVRESGPTVGPGIDGVLFSSGRSRTLGALPSVAHPHSHTGARQHLHIWCDDDPDIAFSPHGRGDERGHA